MAGQRHQRSFAQEDWRSLFLQMHGHELIYDGINALNRHVPSVGLVDVARKAHPQAFMPEREPNFYTNDTAETASTSWPKNRYSYRELFARAADGQLFGRDVRLVSFRSGLFQTLEVQPGAPAS